MYIYFILFFTLKLSAESVREIFQISGAAIIDESIAFDKMLNIGLEKKDTGSKKKNGTKNWGIRCFKGTKIEDEKMGEKFLNPLEVMGFFFLVNQSSPVPYEYYRETRIGESS